MAMVDAAMKHEEEVLLQPYLEKYAAMSHEITTEMLESCMLYQATRDPLCISEYLTGGGDGDGQVRHGIVRYLRDQQFPVTANRIFDPWFGMLQERVPVEAFWSLVFAMFVDRGVLNLVRQTWQGPELVWDWLMEYYRNRRRELSESPWDPENAHEIVYGLWTDIRHDVLPFNIRQILLGGVLRVVKMPLSRKAQKKRSGAMTAMNHQREAALSAEKDHQLLLAQQAQALSAEATQQLWQQQQQQVKEEEEDLEEEDEE